MNLIPIKNRSKAMEQNPDLPQFLLNQDFGDIGELGSQVGWDLEFRQLDAGKLRAHAAVIASKKMASIRVEFNRGFHQQGMAPKEAWTFGLTDNNCGEFSWCGTGARGGDLLNFNLDSGFDGHSLAGFSGYTISFDRASFLRLVTILGLDRDVLNQTRQLSTWPGQAAELHKLSLKMKTVYHLASVDSEITAPHVTNLFETEAAEAIIEVLASGVTGSVTQSVSERHKVVHQALELINEPEFLPLKVADICVLTGVSAPTLYRGFMEQFGISPKKYLLSRMLQGARNELRDSNPSEHVYQIANRWGFWHMGQFGVDYKAQFGEMPSETLAR